jgi:hypothetical protein
MKSMLLAEIRRFRRILDACQLDHPLGADSDIVVKQTLERSFVHLEVIAEGTDFGDIGFLDDMINHLINEKNLFIPFRKLGPDQLLDMCDHKMLFFLSKYIRLK